MQESIVKFQHLIVEHQDRNLVICGVVNTLPSVQIGAGCRNNLVLLY
jgi:hypothetical protein